ncbi:MAG: hypothetical protein M5U26_24245 [Planctomycetota bacterium]|nr:hypothetical protein [Planctomycetota bacterium]
MNIRTAFDGGCMQPCDIEGNLIRFDFTGPRKVGEGHVFFFEVETEHPALRVRLRLDRKGARHLSAQGVVAGRDFGAYSTYPLEPSGAEFEYEAVIPVSGGVVRVANRYPYGRDALDALLCETSACPHGRWRQVRRDGRAFPMFELGDPDSPLIHYFVAGEDAWETSSIWTADAMIRALHADAALREKVLCKGCCRLVPLLSPYSATRESHSYITPQNEHLYLGAAWGDAKRPPELAAMSEMIESSIRERRLGLVFPLHAYEAAKPYSELEAIETSGARRLSPERKAWAWRVLETLAAEVPNSKAVLPEKVWYPGNARHYLLDRFNALTFRIEVTTAGVGFDYFRACGRGLLSGFAQLEDWSQVLPLDGPAS